MRELRNILERGAYLARASGETELRMLGIATRPRQTEGADGVFMFEQASSYRDTRAHFDSLFEKKYVTWLLARHGGNVSAAAREAQMDRKHLSDLARKHDLNAK
ncbi:MAG: hypothetical protein NVSMB1_26250 [Polyangiales bacterium]